MSHFIDFSVVLRYDTELEDPVYRVSIPSILLFETRERAECLF